MIITDIVDLRTGKTRTDNIYPQRIGSTVEFYHGPIEGEVMVLSYVKDNQGNPKDGGIRTSTVNHVIESGNVIAVYTRNSVYYLEK